MMLLTRRFSGAVAMMLLVSIVFVSHQLWPRQQNLTKQADESNRSRVQRPKVCEKARRQSCGTGCTNTFWVNWINRAFDETYSEHKKYAGWYRERMNKDKEYEYQEVAKIAFHDYPPVTLRVMDMGAGLLTSVGYVWPGHIIDLVPVDQADFGTILQQYNVSPPVPTLDRMSMYMLLERFPAESFDFITVNNALTAHNNLDGILCALEVGMRLLKPDGAMWINDGVFGSYNFMINERGKVGVRSEDGTWKVFLDEHLRKFRVKVTVLSPYNQKIKGIPSSGKSIGFLIQRHSK